MLISMSQMLILFGIISEIMCWHPFKDRVKKSRVGFYSNHDEYSKIPVSITSRKDMSSDSSQLINSIIGFQPLASSLPQETSTANYDIKEPLAETKEVIKYLNEHQIDFLYEPMETSSEFKEIREDLTRSLDFMDDLQKFKYFISHDHLKLITDLNDKLIKHDQNELLKGIQQNVQNDQPFRPLTMNKL